MKLSPKQQAVLNCLRQRWAPLPYGNNFEPIRTRPWSWAWSWELNQYCKTADYRRRIWELNNEKGYRIVPFRVGTRHGYVLLSEPQTHGELAFRESA